MTSLNQFGDVLNEFLQLKAIPEAILVEPIAEGKWSIREIVGHLLYWDKFNLETMVPLMTDGAKLPSFPDHDSHNEEAVSYLERFNNAEDLINEFAKTRKGLIIELTSLSKDLKFEIENEPQIFTIERFLTIFVDHDAHHL